MDPKKYFEQNKANLSDREKVAVKVGGLITIARLHAKMSQTELAKAIGTQQPSVARAEKGEVVPSIEFLYKVAKAIRTEFIYPKFGFMEDHNKVANYEVQAILFEGNLSFQKENSIPAVYPNYQQNYSVSATS